MGKIAPVGVGQRVEGKQAQDQQRGHGQGHEGRRPAAYGRDGRRCGGFWDVRLAMIHATSGHIPRREVIHANFCSQELTGPHRCELTFQMLASVTSARRRRGRTGPGSAVRKARCPDDPGHIGDQQARRAGTGGHPSHGGSLRPAKEPSGRQ